MKTTTDRSVPTLALALTGLLAVSAPTQSPCSGLGSAPVAARCEPSPVALGCAHAPGWPQWHLLVPAHRAPVRHVGFDPGDAHALPCVLVTWRCTGLWLVPVTVARVRYMGYVIDQPEHACAAGA